MLIFPNTHQSFVDQISEAEIDLQVLENVRENGWSKDSYRYQHTYAPGRIYKTDDSFERDEPFRPDIVLYYKPDTKDSQEKVLAVIEDKKVPDNAVAAGIQQAIDYAMILGAKFAYASNGNVFVEYDFTSGKQSKPFSKFPTPDELWNRSQGEVILDNEKMSIIFQPYNRQIKNADLTIKQPRYYQAAAIENAVEAIARGDKRVLITMATGTGKTFVAMQIAWKLWKPKKTKPRILYLVDRTFLLEQAQEDYFEKVFGKAVSSIKDKDTGEIVKSRDIYFTLYQGIDDKKNVEGLYKEYSPDFFDYVIIDECHRGSANDEGSWRAILEYFTDAVHIGMTATPKTKENTNTYRYFGKPVYTYTLKQGIDDGFLSPYSVIRVESDVDVTGWKPYTGQKDIYGKDIPDKEYRTPDYDRKITLTPRVKFVAKHLIDYLNRTSVYDKTLVFCQDQQHALEMMIAINEIRPVNHPKYCVRIVAEERENIRKELKEKFSDAESKFPVIVTTSKLLSTGVDIPTLKNIVIDKTIKDMVEFKQTVGRGTRVNLTDKPFSTKYWFTIIDHRGTSQHFHDPQFDGEPDDIQIEKWTKGKPTIKKKKQSRPHTVDVTGKVKHKERPVVDGFEVDTATKSFYKLDADGNRLSMYKYEDYAKEKIRELYPDKMELYRLLKEPEQRKLFKQKLEKLQINLKDLQMITDNTDKDAFEILVSLAYGDKTISRRDKILKIKQKRPFGKYRGIAQKVLDTVLDLYAEEGYSELEKPKELLTLPQIKKFGSPVEIVKEFGGIKEYEKAVESLNQLIYER